MSVPWNDSANPILFRARAILLIFPLYLYDVPFASPAGGAVGAASDRAVTFEVAPTLRVGTPTLRGKNPS